MSVFFTIGHSTRTLDEFVALLRESRVGLVVDVRSIPRSRTNPQYDRDTLPGALGGFQIGYEHIAELGGRKGRSRGGGEANGYWRVAGFRNYADYALTPPFAEGLAQLRSLAAHSRPAIMCAEAVWWRCHRRIIADVIALEHGTEVQHLMHTGDLRVHEPSDGARLEDGHIVWDGAAEAEGTPASGADA